MKKIIYILIFLIQSFCSYAQTGTIGDPFTSLNQGAAVTIPGIYYFNVGGNTFGTHIDANGYVQVAIDFGNGTGNLPQGTSLTTTTRGILNTTILAALTETAEVRMSSSTGNFDLTTTDATIISRIQSNITLHQGSADNAINDNWTGTNSIYMTANTICVTSSGTSLHQNIVHGCGNTNVTHWIPSGNFQMERHANGEIGNTAFLQLWVKGEASVLPIELLNFSAKPMDNSLVQLNWQTASEINNDYFTIERSINGMDWEVLNNIDGAGNSSILLSYFSIDKFPHFGISYYRLKQTDFDGQFSYSNIVAVDIESINSISIYPIPTNDIITITGNESDLREIIVLNSLGQNVTQLIKVEQQSKRSVIVNLTNLSKGLYFIKTKTTANKLYKQ